MFKMFVRLSRGMCHGRSAFRLICTVLSEQLTAPVVSADAGGSSSFSNVGRYTADSMVLHLRTSYLRSQYRYNLP
jgi:hypothetical protein